MKSSKKKAAKKSKGPAKKSPKKPESKVIAVMSQDQYRVDMETPVTGQKEGFAYAIKIAATDAQDAHGIMAELKNIGVGGRLVKLDGTPEGVVVERWGSIGRVLNAETIEKQGIEQGQKN